MSVILAATYHPRGELERLQRLYSLMQSAYSAIIISMPPVVNEADVRVIESLPNVCVIVNTDWSHGRAMALKTALKADGTHVHYADMDRLLRWIETYESEWRQALQRIEASDCLVIGRTERAWATHPQALIQTEAITNGVFSALLGQPLDIGAGSKGFSHEVAAFISRHAQVGKAIGADSEWVVLAYRGGYEIESVLVDGLDWESADQFQVQAADSAAQKAAADRYDADAARWAMRVRVSQEVVEVGLETMARDLALIE